MKKLIYLLILLLFSSIAFATLPTDTMKFALHCENDLTDETGQLSLVDTGHTVQYGQTPAQGTYACSADNVGWANDTITGFNVTQDWTFCAWMNLTIVDDNEVFGVFAGTYYHMTYDSFGIKKEPYLNGNNLNVWNYVDYITAGQWYHVCWVHDDDANTVDVWLNGSNLYTESSQAATNSGYTDYRMFSYQLDAYIKTSGGQDAIYLWNETLTIIQVQELFNASYGDQRFYPFAAAETIPPNIDDTTWNLTSDGDCPNWRRNKTIPCVTTDVDPTWTFDTDENADCAAAPWNGNYTNISNTDADLIASTTGGTTHIFTVPADYALDYVNNTWYVGCADSSGNENKTSTSGPLTIYYSNKGIIPEDVGSPFFINTSKTNNNNSIHFSLNAGETYEWNLTVTTNYTTLSNWSFFTFANISTFYNYSSYVNISIISVGGDTCTCPGLGTSHTFDLSDNCEVEYCMAGDLNFIGTGNPVRCYGEWSIYNINMTVDQWIINTDTNCDINMSSA